MTMIYIGNLSDQANAAQTRALFERYGVVLSFHLTPAGARHRFDGFGLVEMEATAAHRAIAGIDGQVYQGAILSVYEAPASPASDTVGPAGSSVKSDESLLSAARRRCELVAVERVAGPGGAEGDDWHRYVLVRCGSQIVGFRRGSLEEVTEYAAHCVEAFNERSLFCRGTYPTRAQGRPRSR